MARPPTARVDPHARARWLLVALAVLLLGVIVALVTVVPRSTCGGGTAAIGCAEGSLRPRAGESLVTATARLTGRRTIVDGTPRHQLALRGVHVLAGEARPASITGWLATVPSISGTLASAQVPGATAALAIRS